MLGPPVAGHPRPGGALPQGHRAGPVGRGSPSALCRSQVYVEARSFTHPQARRRRTAQLAWERQLLVICQPFLADPLGSAGPAVPAHRAPHQEPAPYWIRGTLRLRDRTGRASGQQPRRAQPTSSGYQPQGQRGHPVGTWYREQDDAGIGLRHLARTRREPPRRLPPTAHFPSNLNSSRIRPGPVPAADRRDRGTRPNGGGRPGQRGRGRLGSGRQQRSHRLRQSRQRSGQPRDLGDSVRRHRHLRPGPDRPATDSRFAGIAYDHAEHVLTLTTEGGDSIDVDLDRDYRPPPPVPTLVPLPTPH